MKWEIIYNDYDEGMDVEVGTPEQILKSLDFYRENGYTVKEISCGRWMVEP